MGKNLSIFIDESGDVGFIKDASKYYIITFVMHNQNDDIKSNIEKIKEYPTFHAGPIIRREYPFDNMEMKDRKKIFQSIFMFTLSLPIKFFSFCYEKKDFNSDLLKMQAKITKDVYNFLVDNFDYLNAFDEIISGLYYPFSCKYLAICKENDEIKEKMIDGHMHAHLFEEVVSALYEHPESFKISKDEEIYYNNQELKYLKRLQKYLLFIGMKDIKTTDRQQNRYCNKLQKNMLML